jgi:hypothetical protein
MIHNQNQLFLKFGWETFCYDLFKYILSTKHAYIFPISIKNYINHALVKKEQLNYDLLNDEDSIKLFELVINQLKVNNKLILQEVNEGYKIYLA